MFVFFIDRCDSSTYARTLHSHHHNLLLSTEEESELINHGLHNVLQMRPHGLELAEITELVLQQGGPPTDGQVLAVHAVVLALLSNSGKKKKNSSKQLNKHLFQVETSPDKMLEDEF